VVDRSTLSNGCVSGLKEVRVRTVGFVRSGSVRFDRCSMRSMFNRPSVW